MFKQWFLAPESEIPAEIGFSLYGQWHLLALGLILLVTLILLIRVRCLREGEYRCCLKILALGMILLELLKELVMAAAGTFTKGYLPLHLCSLSMFGCLYYAWHPQNRRFGVVVYSIGTAGAVCALLFPDWTAFPIWHFQSLHSFLWHTLLLQASLLPVVRGEVRPTVRLIPYTMAMLLCTALPVGILNLLLHTNYMFLCWAPAGSPLVLLSGLPGGMVTYLAGMALFAAVVLLMMNLPFSVMRRLVRRKPDSTYDRM